MFDLVIRTKTVGQSDRPCSRDRDEDSIRIFPSQKFHNTCRSLPHFTAPTHVNMISWYVSHSIPIKSRNHPLKMAGLIPSGKLT